MIPLKDDNPTSGRPVVTYFLIGLCVLVFFAQLGSETYKTGKLFYSYGLIPSVLMGHTLTLVAVLFFSQEIGFGMHSTLQAKGGQTAFVKYQTSF